MKSSECHAANREGSLKLSVAKLFSLEGTTLSKVGHVGLFEKKMCLQNTHTCLCLSQSDEILANLFTLPHKFQ